MASCSLSNLGLQGPLIITHKSHFSGQNHLTILPSTHLKTAPNKPTLTTAIRAKLKLGELLGGRGLCNGEVGLQQELQNEPENPPKTSAENGESLTTTEETEGIPDDAFEKELFGLTGGFPGGEKGLQKFLEGYPLHDLIEAEKNAVNELVSRSMKIIKLLNQLKLKLPQLSSSTGEDRSR